MQPDIETIIANLDAAATDTGKTPAGIWDLIRSIHSKPVLRDWVSLESLPLQPWLISFPGNQPNAILATFLSCPAAAEALQMPWALIAWHLPSYELVCLLKTTAFFSGLSSPFHQLHLATEEYCSQLESAFREGHECRQPQHPLERLYREFLLRCPWGLSSSPNLSSGALDAKNVGMSVKREDSTDRSLPFDLDSNQVLELLNAAHEVVGTTRQETLLEEWRRIYSMLSRATFSLAVAGEFSRGKSTLVNHLLGENVVPVGDLPTTAMLTRLRFGSEPSLLYIREDGSRESFPIEPATWETLAQQHEEGSDGVVDLTIPNPWLKEHGLEIIDTPGVNAIFGLRAAAVSEAIGNCEGTLVVISATMAMSLTERAFIEEHILSKKISRIAVVLSRLDQVKAEDRLRVIRFTNSQIVEWAPNAELWIANEIEVVPAEHGIAIVGSDQIKRRIVEWSSASNRVSLQLQQVTGRLAILLTTMRDSLVREQQTRTMSAAAKREAFRKSEAALNRRKLDWEDFRIDTKQRELETQRWTEDALLRATPSLIEDLAYQAEGCSDLKSWWNERLPFLLRRLLAGFDRTLNQELNRRLESDALALTQKVAQHFEQEPALQKPDGISSPVSGIETNSTNEKAKLQDLSKTQRLIQVGFTALSAASFLLPGGALLRAAAMMGAALTGTFFNKMMGSRITDQKALLRGALGQAIETIFTETLRQLKPRVAAYYSNIMQDMQKREALWYEMQLKALNGPSPQTELNSTSLDAQLEQVQTLLTKTGC